MKVTIYGRSDDCIELEGDVRDEFNAYDCWEYLHFPDGTIVKVGYGEVPHKGWHIEVVKAGNATATPLAPKYQDDEHCTDRLELEGDELSSVECWGSMEGPTDDDMKAFWDEFDTSDYTLPQLAAAYRALKAE